MATTPEGAALTTLYLRQQAALAAQVTGVVVDMVPGMDLTSFATVDRSWPAVEKALSGAVAEGYVRSSGAALNYFEQFRAVEGVPGAAPTVLARTLPPAQVGTSLKVTGPYVAKHWIARKDGETLGKTLMSLIGSTARLVLSGGRRTLHDSGQADSLLLGWSRVCGSARPCAFCRMLRSRGPVYKTEGAASFKAHDFCRCHAEGVYSMDSDWAPGARDDLDIWDRSTEGLSGNDALKAFRAAIGTGH